MGWLIEIDGKKDPRRFKDYTEASEALARDLNAGKVTGKDIRLRQSTGAEDNPQPTSFGCLFIAMLPGFGLAAGIIKAAMDSMWHCLKTGNLILFAVDWFFPPVAVIHGVGLWFGYWGK